MRLSAPAQAAPVSVLAPPARSGRTRAPAPRASWCAATRGVRLLGLAASLRRARTRLDKKPPIPPKPRRARR